MAKMETVYHGRNLIIDKFVDNAGIPDSEKYRITTFRKDHHYHDELILTESQFMDLQNFALGNTDNVIANPFYEEEIYEEFQPRFGGTNPDYKDFYWNGWSSAFAYVNDILRKGREDVRREI